MISVIICSRNTHPPAVFSASLQQSIGVAYEVICIDNSSNTYSICSAYNKGALMSRFDILCFVHDDVLFHTGGWGNTIANMLQSNQCGVIAVAGATIKTAAPSPWWITNYCKLPYLHSHIIQHSSKGSTLNTSFANAAPAAAVPVVVTDGVLMCCHKKLWQQYPFDEQRYTGFHFYDMDFSATLHQHGYTNYVTNAVLIEHLSAGRLSREWAEAAIVFHKKWKKQLPMFAANAGVDAKALQLAEAEAWKGWLIELCRTKYKGIVLWCSYWLQYWLLRPMHKSSYALLLRRIIKGRV
ncbi:MAG TPA: glycosyltransferase [Ferruginibacter sp.]|nr:glycosyltransferase [Ferruginibacter sp.]HMP21261.1 glycosyltransferase [Ferruginibacter sp.]